MNNIKTIAKPNLHKTSFESNCGECSSSCQSACKTSCTVANQQCEKETRINNIKKDQ